MEKRPIKSSHGNELLDPEFSSFNDPIHHNNPWTMGNAANFLNRSFPSFPQPLLCHAPENVMNYSDYGIYHSNRFKANQNHQLDANSRVSYFTQPIPSFISNQYMASSSSNPPPPFHEGMASCMDEHALRNYDLNYGSRWLKRKNAETGAFYHGSGAPTSGSSLSRDSSLGTRSLEANMLNATQFIQHDRQFLCLPVQNGYQQNVNTFTLPFQPSLLHHQNYLLQVQRNNYMGQVFQPARSNMCLDQYAHAIGDVGSSNRNYTSTAPPLLGRSLNRGSPIEIGNHGNSSNQDPTSSRDTTGSSHNLIFHNSHPHPVQDIHSHHHNHHDVSGSPCDRYVNNNMGSDFTNSPRDNLDLERINEFHQHHRQQYSSGLNMLTEDVDLLPFSSDYNIDNLIDRYRNMRMDIDHMTYEELLALQEKIGYVRIGLSEESVLKQLKTKLYLHPFLSLSGKSSHRQIPESEKCTICQVVFEKYDKIGILDCGHFYHPNCIKDWLLVKNTCPICKAKALPSEEV